MNATRRLAKESPQRADINPSAPNRLIKAINHGFGGINAGEFGFRFGLERWRSIESQSELNLRLPSFGCRVEYRIGNDQIVIV
jgi:hypothetical protein